jgi:hypothetical protein
MTEQIDPDVTPEIAAEQVPAASVAMNIGKELVPLSYQLDTWNAYHGSELAHHTDHLTATEAARINSHYSTEIYVGAHGIIPDKPSNDPAILEQMPSQQDYDQVAEMVDSLGPDDTLFVENMGFDRQALPPIPPQAVEMEIPENADPMIRFYLQTSKDMLKSSLSGSRQELERQRQNYEISAWDYAQKLALLKGVRVIYADQNAFEEARFKEIAGGKDVRELMLGDEGEQMLAEREHAYRERVARNIVKDFALENLPPEGAPVLTVNERPRLALLIGKKHQAEIKQAFVDLDLVASMHTMKTSDRQSRLVEQLSRRTPTLPSTIGASALVGGDMVRGLTAAALKARPLAARQARLSRRSLTGSRASAFRHLRVPPGANGGQKVGLEHTSD